MGLYESVWPYHIIITWSGDYMTNMFYFSSAFNTIQPPIAMVMGMDLRFTSCVVDCPQYVGLDNCLYCSGSAPVLSVYVSL